MSEPNRCLDRENDKIEAVVLNAVNRIELQCREAVQERRITQYQADRRIQTAKNVAEFILDRRLNGTKQEKKEIKIATRD